MHRPHKARKQRYSGINESPKYKNELKHKSKTENKAKYAQRFIEQMAEKYGIENIVEITKSIIED